MNSSSAAIARRTASWRSFTMTTQLNMCAPSGWVLPVKYSGSSVAHSAAPGLLAMCCTTLVKATAFGMSTAISLGFSSPTA